MPIQTINARLAMAEKFRRSGRAYFISEDQELFARYYTERNGFEMVAFHVDDGITVTTMERPGLQAVLQHLTSCRVKALTIESMDRLRRDPEHLHYMDKLFRLHGIEVHTVAGKVDDLVLAFKGIIGEQQRMRFAYTTRRELLGKGGRSGATGGKALGYRREIVGQDASGGEHDRLASTGLRPSCFGSSSGFSRGGGGEA